MAVMMGLGQLELAAEAAVLKLGVRAMGLSDETDDPRSSDKVGARFVDDEELSLRRRREELLVKDTTSAVASAAVVEGGCGEGEGAVVRNCGWMVVVVDDVVD